MADSMNHLCPDPSLPPGCRSADCERGASRVDDLPPAALWRLLNERRQSDLYREFFRRQWAELAACLEEPHAAESIQTLWLAWRNTAVNRLAMSGQIQLPR